MQILLNILYENNYYLFCLYDNKVYFIKHNKQTTLKIQQYEMQTLINLVNELVSDNFNPQEFLSKNILLLQKDMKVSFILECAIPIALDRNQFNNFIINCDKLESYIPELKVIVELTKPVKFLLGCIICLIIVASNLYVENGKITLTKIDNSAILEKYTYKFKTDNYIRNNDMKIVKIIKQVPKEKFNTKYLTLENIFKDYNLVENMNNDDTLEMVVYEKNEEYQVSFWREQNPENEINFDDYQIDTKNKKINIKDTFKRNKIKNQTDLIYNIILYSKKNLTKKSSKDEIKDNYVFQSVREKTIPYNIESKINKIIFFTKDIYGFAYINDNQTFIQLLKNDISYRIVLSPSLTEEEIINLVSTIEYKEV